MNKGSSMSDEEEITLSGGAKVFIETQWCLAKVDLGSTNGVFGSIIEVVFGLE